MKKNVFEPLLSSEVRVIKMNRDAVEEVLRESLTSRVFQLFNLEPDTAIDCRMIWDKRNDDLAFYVYRRNKNESALHRFNRIKRIARCVEKEIGYTTVSVCDPLKNIFQYLIVRAPNAEGNERTSM